MHVKNVKNSRGHQGASGHATLRKYGNLRVLYSFEAIKPDCWDRPPIRLATVRFGSCSGVLGPNLNLHIEVRFK